MIQFDEDTRAALFSAGVLVIDDDGKTVFTGLTAAETRFVLDFEEADLCGTREQSNLFRELLAKFHSAREFKMLNAEQLTDHRLNSIRSTRPQRSSRTLPTSPSDVPDSD